MSNQVKTITKKSEDISAWYQDVIRESKLAEHGPSKGSIIIRPYGYAIWESIQKDLDTKLKALGAENAYFPLFIPISFLEKEKDHVEGFSPELAVVTHGGGEKLAEALVVRPTSETIMYDAYSRWIQSFRDLPLMINQWNNVVRWEKRPNLFLRTTEFLWQEGHTAHETKDEAIDLQTKALEMYVSTYQDELALYGYAGRKSESEKFAGAVNTFTYEILMPDGKCIQGCTSHDLGQNFSKVFNVKYQDRAGKEQFVWQTSWGYSTRSMGALILAHGDDNGLVLPPRIAPIQVVIIPIYSKGSDTAEILDFAEKVFANIESANIRVQLDNKDYSPGWKFNQYDLQGVPFRIEIGATETNSQKARVVRRDNKEGYEIELKDLSEKLPEIMSQMQSDMFEKTKKLTLENTRVATDYEEFKEIMENERGFIRAFWCEDEKCEAKIKEETKATTRCLPFDSQKTDGKCVYCDKKANYQWIFAQAY